MLLLLCCMLQSPDQLATPSVRNDAAFLFTVTGEDGTFGCTSMLLGAVHLLAWHHSKLVCLAQCRAVLWPWKFCT